MKLLPASSAVIEWNAAHSRWEVHIAVGAEVIKRPIGADMTAEALARRAVEIAADEGYELDPAKIIQVARA
jgi:hypothetical protein